MPGMGRNQQLTADMLYYTDFAGKNITVAHEAHKSIIKARGYNWNTSDRPLGYES